MNYLQKKKQAIIMMLAAHIIKSAEGYPVTIGDSESGAAVDYTIYGNSGAVGKNLIPYPYRDSTKTQSGVTFTDNGDGSVTANGTASENALFALNQQLKIPKGKYILSGLNAEGSVSTYRINITLYNGDTVVNAFCDFGNGAIVDLSSIEFTRLNVYILINKNTTVDNITIKPQLELSETATEYEKYRSPITVSAYLKKPIKKGESVNFRSGGLPKLTLFEGTNIITTGTAIKPEKISVDYYEKRKD